MSGNIQRQNSREEIPYKKEVGSDEFEEVWEFNEITSSISQ